MTTPLAPITPSVLLWARQSIHVSLEEAAKRIDVPAERVAGWEEGRAEPTLAKVRELAKLYQQPLAVFFGPEPPCRLDELPDGRTLPDDADPTWSRALHKVFRRAKDQQATLVDLLQPSGPTGSDEGEDGGGTMPVPSVTLDADPEDAAETARTWLGVDVGTQFLWRNPEVVLGSWIALVEARGVFVLRTSEVPVSEMRGFSIGSERAPIVVVNALDSRRSQVFTLLHELVHLMVAEDGLCNVVAGPGTVPDVERFGNAVAGAMLVPAPSLRDNALVVDHAGGEWEDEILARLGNMYGTTEEVVLRRLMVLGLATEELYLARRDGYLAAYEEQLAGERARSRRPAGGPPPYRMVVRDRGRPYVRAVLDGYHRQVVGPTAVSQLLGLKLKHLPALQHEVRPR